MDLRSDKRQKTQQERDSSVAERGEAQRPQQREFESLPTMHEAERPTDTERMMEAICEWGNLKEAIRQVKANKGSAGIDGVTVDELPDYSELVVIREQLLSGSYKPQPVQRVEIPKPDGGVRKLGIPTTRDRGDPASGDAGSAAAVGTGRFPTAALDSGQAGRLIRLWRRHSSIWLRVTAGWWTWIWRNSSTESITTS